MEFLDAWSCPVRPGLGDIVFRSVGSAGGVDVAAVGMVSGERQCQEKLRQASLVVQTLGDEEQQEIQRRREASETRRRMLEQDSEKRAAAACELQSRLARRRAASEESFGGETGYPRSVSAPRREKQTQKPAPVCGTASVPAPPPPRSGPFLSRPTPPPVFAGNNELQARLARRRVASEDNVEEKEGADCSSTAATPLVTGPPPARAVEMRLKRSASEAGGIGIAARAPCGGAPAAAPSIAPAPSAIGELEARLAERRRAVAMSENVMRPGVEVSRPPCRRPHAKAREVHEKENAVAACQSKIQEAGDIRRPGTPLRRTPLADVTGDSNGVGRVDCKQKELQAILARRRAVCDESENTRMGATTAFR